MSPRPGTQGVESIAGLGLELRFRFVYLGKMEIEVLDGLGFRV